MPKYVIPPRRPGFPAAAAILAAWVLWILPGGGPSAQEPRSGKPRLSVLYFSDTRGAPDFAWLSKGLADMLAGDLGATGAFTLVEREELERVLREQELALSGLVDPAGAPKVGRLLGADLLLYGSFLASGEELRITAPTFFSFAYAVMNPGRFGFKDPAEVTEAYRAHPYRMSGDTPVQAVWNLQNLLHELGRSAAENFGDEALAERCRDEVLRWSEAAESAYPRDPFLPEVLYQKIFVHVDREDWQSLRTLCERLMSDYPDYRMMWAVEDFYERALEELGG